MNKHLEVIYAVSVLLVLILSRQTLAQKHTTTRFLRVDVANVPFLVVKLEIKVLPQIICFENGITKDKYDHLHANMRDSLTRAISRRIIGFDTVGESTDNFTTAQLELRLSQSGVIDTAKPASSAVRRPNFAS